MILKRIIGHLAVFTFTITFIPTIGSSSFSYSADCEPIARNYTSGKVICKGETVGASSPVKLLCFLNQQWVNLTHLSIIGNVCYEPKVINRGTIKRCTQFNQGKPGCWTAKGANSINEPEIIAPYSSTIINGRPKFIWTKVLNASNYLIQIKGKGVSWSEETKSTQLSYPKEQPSLAPGEVYQIITTALSGTTPYSSDSASITMLPISDAVQVRSQIQFIREQNIPVDEAAYLDMDVIYRHFDLYTETINSLNSRVSAGSSNPDLYRVLANRYAQVGLPQFAQKYYDQGIFYAEQQHNSIAIKKIKSAIAQAIANSPPE